MARIIHLILINMKLSTKLILLLVFTSGSITAQINRYSKPVEQTLERYVPGSASQESVAYLAEINRLTAIVRGYKQYYSAIESFKEVPNGTYEVVVIIAEILKSDGFVTVGDGKVKKLMLKKAYDSTNGLHITANIRNAYTKVFLKEDDKMIPVEIYIPEFFIN